VQPVAHEDGVRRGDANGFQQRVEGVRVWLHMLEVTGVDASVEKVEQAIALQVLLVNMLRPVGVGQQTRPQTTRPQCLEHRLRVFARSCRRRPMLQVAEDRLVVQGVVDGKPGCDARVA